MNQLRIPKAPLFSIVRLSVQLYTRINSPTIRTINCHNNNQFSSVRHTCSNHPLIFATYFWLLDPKTMSLRLNEMHFPHAPKQDFISLISPENAAKVDFPSRRGTPFLFSSLFPVFLFSCSTSAFFNNYSFRSVQRIIHGWIKSLVLPLCYKQRGTSTLKSCNNIA